MASEMRLILLIGCLAVVCGQRVMHEYRVPQNIEPTHYTLKMLTTLSDDFNYLGEVWIDINAKQETKSIVLNLKNLNVFENETKVEYVSSKIKRDVSIANMRRLAMRERMKFKDARQETAETPSSSPPPSSPPQTIAASSTESTAAITSTTPTPTPLPSTTTAQPFIPSTPEKELPPAEPTTSTTKLPSTSPSPTLEASTSTTTLKPVPSTTTSSTTELPMSSSTEVPMSSSTEAPMSPTTELPRSTSTTTTKVPDSTSTASLVTEGISEDSVTEKESTPESDIKEPVSEESDDNSVQVISHDFDDERQFVTLELNKAMKAGSKYRIYMKFQGFLNDNLVGFYRVAYAKRNKRTSWLAATVFEPIEARSAFPCFDEPEYKATFDIILGHSNEYTALSNMPLRSTKLIGDKPGWQWDYFETTPRMSTYLVAFLISDLESLDLGATNKARNSTEFRYWARHDVIHKAKYASKVVPKMMTYLEKNLGVNDVMPKYDLVAMPSFITHALENWGLISFSEKSMLFTPGYSSILSKYEMTRVLGHELSHSFFGNSITPRWWDQIWLSEGLCNFYETKLADHVQPDWDVLTFSAVSSYLRVFSIDALYGTHALVPQVRNLNDLNNVFDSLTYQKGYYLIRMLNFTLGEEAFTEGMRTYVKKNQLSTVQEENLWSCLTPAAHSKGTLPAHMDLNDVMKSWTREAGYPVIQVTRDYANRSATITQKRFVRPKEDYEQRSPNGSISGETRWYIPVTYTTGQEMRFADTKPRLWLQPDQNEVILQDVAEENDFLLMNIKAAGLYRVNYDYDNWALLVDQLLSENYTNIDVVNRVQILDDLLDFARAGEISYQQALDATSYLRREKHYLPWKAAFSNFEYISRMLRSTDSGKIFKKFMRNLVTERYDELGFQPKKDETLFESMNRKQIVKWACRTGQRQCVRQSVSLFKKWTEEKKPDEVNPIPSNLRSVVYCTAIEQGGARDWNFLWQRYLSNIVVTDKAAIIASLGCSRNTRTLRKYLDWSLKETSGVKKQDSVAVFKAVAGNDVGFPIAKKFLKERISEVPKYVGMSGRQIPNLVNALATKMNQMKDLEELELLEQENASTLRTAPSTVRQAVEKVRFNIGWVQTNLGPITEWLKRQTNT